MKADQKKKITEDIKGLEYEKGNVRKLATQMTTVLLEHQAGKNPYKLAWDIAKAVGKKNPNFTAKHVVDELENFSKELSQTPEYDEEYFREQGMKGSESLSHAQRVENGHKGAESYTKVK